MSRFEPILLALFFAAWIGALLHGVGVLSLAGSLPLALYPYFILAATLGWTMGNVYVTRRRGLPGELLYLARSMAPEAEQRMAPLVPIFAFAVFGVFFLVPVSLARVFRT
jgi:hypothetical protein